MSTSRRDSDSKRHSSSKYDRDPSPKRSRKDDSEKRPVNDDGNSRRGRDYDQKLLPHEAASRRAEDAVLSKGSDKKTDHLDDSDKKNPSEKKENGSQSEKKQSSDRSHIQHDDRGNTRRSDRSFDQRPSSDRAWGKDSRDQHGNREASRYKRHTRDDRAAGGGNKDGSWRHDGFFEFEANPPQATLRKRPAFSEQKIAVDDVKKELPNKSVRDGRGSRIPQHLERDRGVRRPYNGDRGITNRGEHQGFGSSSGDRFGGSTVSNRARDGTYARHEHHQATALSDKWKHDMFSEANRSPTPKNEEDQIAKVEALLAS